jgi:HSP20 family protein
MWYTYNKKLYDQLINDVYGNLESYTEADMKDYGDFFAVSLVVPGADRQDIKITNRENALHVSYNPEKQNKFCAKFEKAWRFSGVDFEKIGATYTNGVLNITVPKSKKPEPEVRTIAVN